MKRLFNTVAFVLAMSLMAMPAAEAQSRGRGNSGNSSQHSSAPAQRPGNSGQGNRPNPGNNGNHNNGNHNNGNNNGWNNSNRPNTGNNGNHNNGNHNNGNHNNGNQANRPGYGNNNRPGSNPGYGGPSAKPPGHNNGSWNYPGPSRPHMPSHRPFSRPVPPASWRPNPGWRAFNSILGLTLGTAFNISVNNLYANGYNVTSYGNNMIMVANANMLNMLWPDGILYYNTYGQLYGSRFIYSTTAYDMSRYNMAYSMLASNYGAPVSVQNTGNGIEATWWGTGNQFIRLSYEPEYAYNGILRYYTTLSFGN